MDIVAILLALVAFLIAIAAIILVFVRSGSTGPQGPQGSQGPQGTPGSQGSQGPSGVSGIQGPTGPAGPPMGPTGPIGPTGTPGSVGVVGYSLNNSNTGVPGVVSISGFNPYTTNSLAGEYIILTGTATSPTPVIELSNDFNFELGQVFIIDTSTATGAISLGTRNSFYSLGSYANPNSGVFNIIPGSVVMFMLLPDGMLQPSYWSAYPVNTAPNTITNRKSYRNPAIRSKNILR